MVILKFAWDNPWRLLQKGPDTESPLTMLVILIMVISS
jgi:hypothetical protein